MQCILPQDVTPDVATLDALTSQTIEQHKKHR